MKQWSEIIRKVKQGQKSTTGESQRPECNCKGRQSDKDSNRHNAELIKEQLSYCGRIKLLFV